MIRANQPGSVCARTSCDPGSGVARRVRGSYPFEAHYRADRLFWARHAAAQEGFMSTTPRPKRDQLEDALHRLSNHVECQLCGLLTDLMSEGRTSAVTDLAWQGSLFVKTCREIRDGREGGDE